MRAAQAPEEPESSDCDKYIADTERDRIVHPRWQDKPIFQKPKASNGEGKEKVLGLKKPLAHRPQAGGRTWNKLFKFTRAKANNKSCDLIRATETHLLSNISVGRKLKAKNCGANPTSTNHGYFRSSG